MKKGFFLYGIDVPGDDPSVDEAVERAVAVFPDGADASLAGRDLAAVVTETALHLAVADFFIK